jgi:polyketide cyclase/dehydrase/lipid transport protein
VKVIEATENTTASRDAVWALLEDPASWAEWGSWSSVEVDGGGPQGVGVERTLVRRPYRVRERITEWEPGRRHSYELLEGMNASGYRSTVTLDDAPGGGTVIRWRSEYERAGPFTAFMLRLAVRDSCKRLAKAASAAQRAASS